MMCFFLLKCYNPCVFKCASIIKEIIMQLLIKTLLLLSVSAIFNVTADSYNSYMDIQSNSITVPAHSRSVDINAKNAATCDEMGGIDITDVSSSKVSAGVINSTICMITDEIKYQKHLKDETGKSTTKISTLSAANGSWEILGVTAPSGYIYSSPYSFVGSMIVTGNGVSQGTIRMNVLTALCGQTFWYTLPANAVNLEVVAILNCGSYPYTQPTSLWSSTSACVINLYSGSCYQGPNQSMSVGGTVIVENNANNILEKNLGNSENTPNCALPSSWQGNPINIAIGNKFQQEIDIRGSGSYPLTFMRSYNSADGYWRHNYSTHLSITGVNIKLVNADGRVSNFYNNNGVIVTTPTELGVLTKNVSNWRYKSPFNEVFDFDSKGRLIKTTNSNGMIHNISYNSAVAESMTITDGFKHSLTLLQDSTYQPLKLTTSDGQVITYSYDSSKRLISVTKNSKTHTYFYENVAFPRALTGITDERGIRYATWSYDAAGRANQSSHGKNIDLVKVTYNSDGSATVTNPLGRESKFSYVVIDGMKRISSIAGSATASCPMSNSSFEYNLNGLLTLQTDARGIKTSYQYNSLGEETSHTIGVGTSEAQTTTTTWNTTLNLPQTVTNSNRSITYSYDSQGRVTGKTIKSLN